MCIWCCAQTARPPVSDGNLFIDQLAGARITHLSRRDYAARLSQVYRELVADYAAQGKKAYTMPVGGSDEVGLWADIAACEELQLDFKAAAIAPRHIVCATGSGGTQGGLSLGVLLQGIDAQVWGVCVCDDAAYFDRKIRADIGAWQTRYAMAAGPGDVSLASIDGYVGPGYGVAGPEIFELIARVVRTEGLLLDPIYTGKAFWGLLEEIRIGKRFADAEDVVFIHTGGFFACYAQREQFAL